MNLPQTKKGHVPTLFRESEGHGLYKKSLSRYSCTLYVLMLLAAIICATINNSSFAHLIFYY